MKSRNVHSEVVFSLSPNNNVSRPCTAVQFTFPCYHLALEAGAVASARSEFHVPSFLSSALRETCLQIRRLRPRFEPSAYPTQRKTYSYSGLQRLHRSLYKASQNISAQQYKGNGLNLAPRPLPLLQTLSRSGRFISCKILLRRGPKKNLEGQR
jgi:hypothetical protein